MADKEYMSEINKGLNKPLHALIDHLNRCAWNGQTSHIYHVCSILQFTDMICCKACLRELSCREPFTAPEMKIIDAHEHATHRCLITQRSYNMA